MKYWQFSIVLFIIMVITALNKCSFLLKSIFFTLKEIFIFSFFFLMILLSSMSTTKRFYPQVHVFQPMLRFIILLLL